jgi:3-oxoacyl-(acyl-carrier-protein) synthase
MSMWRRVVISGVGVVSPAGVGSQAHLAGLLRGRSTTRHLTDPLFAGFDRAIGAGVAAEVGNPDLPRHVAFADLAITEALRESGIDGAEKAATAVVSSTAVGATVELERAYRRQDALRAGSFGFDLVTHWARTRHKVGQQMWSLSLSTGCTAGLDALGSGFDAVASGRADRVLVVSADATLCPIVVAAFRKIGALSTREVAPQHASCPFSGERDGFVLGEGAAAVVLEDRAVALSRGARPLLEMAGWASVSSAYHMTRIRADGEDVAASMRKALDDAGVCADDVDVLDAHGTSTVLNDTSEAAAYHDVFGRRAQHIPVVAQKGVYGHALGASNLLEIAGLVRYMSAGLLPPVANTTAQSLHVPLDLVMSAARRAEPTIAVKTSSGFSGIHTAAVLRRAS